MAKKEKEVKTNAIRSVAAKKLNYEIHTYDISDNLIDGMSVAAKLGQNPESTFKTLVLVGQSKNNYVCVVPVCNELDLKKAAKYFGEKYVEMIPSKALLPLTGYIHGGCSPIGMKKLFPTVIHETAELYDTICVSGGKIGLQIEMSPIDLAGLVNAGFADIIAEK